MSDIKKSVKLLPEYLKTDKNSKFLSATIDPLIQSPQLERIDGFVGSLITPNFNLLTDHYLKEELPLRKEYPLEPALVFKDESSNITDIVGFDDIINEINLQGGKTDNLDRLFRSTFYSYNPPIDWDKLVNYSKYYWLPNGPDSILIDDVISNIEGSSNYLMENGYFLSNGMKVKLSNNKEYYVEGVGKIIKLINIKLLEVHENIAQVYNETFGNTLFDTYSFDSDNRLPLISEYVTINKASSDLNPWSRYNRWFHEDIIRITAEINNQPIVYPFDSRAKRPIIEFKPNIQLYNFGSNGIPNIDIIDTDTVDPFTQIDGTIGYYSDETLLEEGFRIIFNAYDPEKIYKVHFDTTTNPPTLRLIEDHVPEIGDSVAVNYGKTNQGTSWHYATKIIGTTSITQWVKSQQHTTINQAPLFDLYDNSINLTSYSEYNSNFVGNKIFGYEIGTVYDTVLGFPIKYKTSIGVGSYVFKNYFMSDVIIITDSNNVTQKITSGVTRFKINDVLLNIWKSTVGYQVPIIEIQNMATATNVLKIKSITTSATSVISYVNGNLVKSTLDLDGITININTSTIVNKNDVISLEIISPNGVPNLNGFYKTPLGLTNNPLNGPITELTLSELSDHLLTMIDRVEEFDGNFPGSSNLRDLDDYVKYGTRLIINANPIAFTKIFLGKKEHNVVDAIRYSADQYDQFKINFLNILNTVDNKLSPSDALDLVLKQINSNKDTRSLYYRSDMLGYGPNKITRTYKVTSINNIFPIGVDFDLLELSSKSVLVYLNGIQLLSNIDYYFNKIDGRVIIHAPFSINDVVTIQYYLDTYGSFIPPSPTKLGLYPKYNPGINSDTSYTYPVDIIQGHDGSKILAYGDYRDAIILEYEKRIFNNIKVNYNSKIFDIISSMPGVFRTNKYSLSEVNSILTKDFIKWTGQYNIDATTNNVYNESDPFTWNYSNGKFLLGPTPGYWRGIYKYFYDTDRPHTHPWEMLGHTSKPMWWDTYYNWIDYPKRVELIAAITNGIIDELGTINSNYARPAFGAINPVDLDGNLVPPNTFLSNTLSIADKSANWKFGDHGPAETAWRHSSYWPFALNAINALLDPCSYISAMFDTSRISFNLLNQLTYTTDDLYLNPNKLLLDNENVKTSGFSVYVIEKGKHKNLNYVASLKQDLTYINFNLFHKLGGFASKDKLQIIIDSVDPVSQAQGAILPPEDYSLILNVSNPIKSSRISGVIVQRSNGNFIVKGYDTTNPYFEIFKPIKNSASGAITVGGKSESFTEWTGAVNNGNSGLSAIDITSTNANTTHYYRQGQVVRYNGKFYIVKVGHNTQSTFDPILFQALPLLPMVGGATAQLSSKFENNVTVIPYGTSYSTIQDVYDLLVGYGAYLESQGFIFDEYNSDLNDVVNWKFTAKEFLYWTTQNWADGNLITLSPFADYLKYSYINSVVDNIGIGDYDFSILKADGKTFPIDKFQLSRENGICTINTIDTLEGMFFATLNSVQKEHGMVFNNSTIFNDIIYDIETGYRQRRIKLSGFRTSNWNGDLYSPGFVYDNVLITDWLAYNNYLPGKVVRFNGSYYESIVKIVGDSTFEFSKWAKLDNKPVSNLLPNFDYKINQFEDFYSLDIDNFDAVQQSLAQHLIGYTPRTYLNNIFTNSISQYKFYQGYIKEKGTKNAIDKLSKVGRYTRQGNILFNEDWAFRVGDYGSFSTYNELEFNINESTFLENPYIVKFAEKPIDANPLINYVPFSDLLLTPDNYSSSNTFPSIPSTFSDNNLVLTTAGYVRGDDVTATAYNKNSLLDIANNSILQEGNTIWMGFLENGDWGISRYSKQPAKIAGVYVSSPATNITFTTDINHNLAIGDIVSIVRFNNQVNGIHIITDIPRLDQFTVASELTTIVNAELLSYGGLFKFENARYNNIQEVANSPNILNLKENEKIWIDEGVGGKWQVYQKIKNYSTGTQYNSPNYYSEYTDIYLGQSIYTSDNTDILMVSGPGWLPAHRAGKGAVWIYKKHKSTGELEQKFEYGLDLASGNGWTYAQTGVNSDFGYSLAYDKLKNLYFTGAPAASNVVIKNSDVGATGRVILGTQTDAGSTIKTFSSEGVLRISSIDSLFTKETDVVVIVNPFSNTSSNASNARFGHSIYINNTTATTSTTLLVSAPGNSSTSTTGNVYAYQITRENYYKATRADVIYALAANLSAPVYYGEITIINWMTEGLSQFSNLIYEYRAANPLEAAYWDEQRAADGAGIVNSRAEVIAAYQNNPVAQLYPVDADIRYWMINGLGPNNSIFNLTVIENNLANPSQAIANRAERTAVASIKPSIVVSAYPTGIKLNSHVSLTPSSQFGHKISGNSTGTVIAISAPYHIVSAGKTVGVVQIFDKNLSWVQTLTSPFGTSTAFGNDVVVSSDGLYIFVSSMDSKVAGEPFGKVAVYKKYGTQFILSQIIKNPTHRNNLKFGYSISISGNGKTLAISALGTNNSKLIKFDINSKIGETLFDGGITQFTEPLLDAGTIYSYNNINEYFVLAEEIFSPSVVEGSKYGASVAVTNNGIYAGAPTYTIISEDASSFYHFYKIDPTVNSLKLLREQPDLVNISTIDRIALIDSFKEELVEYLDVFDPLKGKIPGIAEEELKYKSAFDPATYTIGLAASIIDASTSWIDDHTGELWWDLSTVKYVWYEQGDDIFRKNNWGKLFPGSTIDVYEWVRSDLLPSEWAAQADTNDGLTKGISGQPKYPDNSIVSVKQIFNNVTNSFENIYFFWVKNKVTVPNVKNRRISSYQISRTIADPTANGLKFAEILSSDSVAFANVQPMLVSDRINANIVIDSISNTIPRHTEWLLLAEGDPYNMPTELLEKKLIDSLLGHDLLGNPVPAINSTYRNRYGISIRPQQTMFKDRKKALRNIVEFANSVLIKNKITNYYSFDNLNKKDEIEDVILREYDFKVEDRTALESIEYSSTVKYSQATLECYVINGKITTVNIISPGYGYTNPPKVTVVSDTSGAEILTNIDDDGQIISVIILNPGNGFETAPELVVRPHTVIVKIDEKYNNIWTKHQYDYKLSKLDQNPTWIMIKNQIYNTPLYWKYVDWVSNNYNSFKEYDYVISHLYDLSTLNNIIPGNYVKIQDSGIVLERTLGSGNFVENYDIVFSTNGTIQILDTTWNYSTLNYAYDEDTLEGTLYDQIPDLEIYYILKALKNDIFINDLKINWNLLFFTAVKYALTEQKLLDWAFKTSFINVTNVIGTFDQRSVYKLSDEKYFEDYIKEVKPYHTQLRKYTSKYSYLEDTALGKLNATDFDLPSYYNTVTNLFDVVRLSNPLINQLPWKDWADNYTSEIGSIVVTKKGKLYTIPPTVTILGGGPYVTSTATADAYISNGGVYQIIVTNGGSGYTETPTVIISGGGPYVTSTATVVGKLLNSKIRKNTIGIKFDRVNYNSEIGETKVSDTFICSGSDDKFVLTWLAETNKLNILPTLDGKLILSSDYTIRYYTEKYNGYSKKYSEFRFLNYIPLENQVFKISYNKNIELYTALDRIKKIHTSTDKLSSLMTGLEYSGSIIQGLPFEYSVPWDTVEGYGKFDIDNSRWSELINYYASAKIVSTASAGSVVLFLNTTTGIMPGQVINILNSSTIRIRPDTTVIDVNTESRAITISRPVFNIQYAHSTATTIGSKITVRTMTPFNIGGLIAGDQIVITGITSPGYNENYIVYQVLDSNNFVIKAKTSLSTTTAVITLSSLVNVNTLLTSINSTSLLLDKFSQTYDKPTSSALVINLHIKYNDISKISIFNDGLTTPMLTGIPVTGPYPGAEYYQMTKDSNGMAIVSFYQLTNPSYYFDFFVYGYPAIEFWKPETLVSGLDTSIPGGSWDNQNNFLNGQGSTFISNSILSTATSNIIDGNAFLNPDFEYAPEELVKGHVLDNLGINVYTKDENSYANVLSGTFPIVQGEITTATLISVPGTYDGLMVYYNGSQLSRLTDAEVERGLHYINQPAVAAGPIGFNPGLIIPDPTNRYAEAEDDIPYPGFFALGFDLVSYGTVYDRIFLGNNGYITLGNQTQGGPSMDWKNRSIGSLTYLDVFTTPANPTYQPVAAIYVHYTDLWSNYGITDRATNTWITPLSTGEIPGQWVSTGTIGTFNYLRVRFQGTHFSRKEDTPTVPAIEYEVVVYSNGTDQYIEMIYENTWRGNDPYGAGFTAGIAGNHSSAYVQVDWKNIEDFSSHLYHSKSTNGGQWVYLGPGKFDHTRRNPFYGFTFPRQYYMEGNIIHVAPQQYPGRAGYTMLTVGGDRSVIDSNMVVVTNSSTCIVESVASIDDVRKAYVTVGGSPINEITNTSDYGYMLTYVGEKNKRACVKVYGLDPMWTHTVEAWFFESNYTNFNNMHESVFEIAPTYLNVNITLDVPLSSNEPVSNQLIVTQTSIGQDGNVFVYRLDPPKASYYIVKNNQLTFEINNEEGYPQNYFKTDEIRVYANGIKLRPGFDYTLDLIYSQVTIMDGLLTDGDVVAIENLKFAAYIVTGNNVYMKTSFLGGATVRIISFGNADKNLMVRTETFSTYNIYNTYKLLYPLLSDNHIWISDLRRGIDYELLDDMQTIKFRYRYDSGGLLITTFNPTVTSPHILGYRIFNDMFDRNHFNRLSSFYTTRLDQPLHYNDTEIHVTDSSNLVPGNPLTNKPGVIIIDAERIEFFIKDGNTLRQLRRGTLGTSIPSISHAGTTVIDQSPLQDIPTSPYVKAKLVRPVYTTSTEIYLDDAGKIMPPDQSTGIPGVVLINGKRIEFGAKNGNILTHVTTASGRYSSTIIGVSGDIVTDQVIQPWASSYKEMTFIQTTSTTSSTYIINTLTNGITGAGIILNPNIPAADQVTVYYGGRQLRKSDLVVHDKTKSYDPMPNSITMLPPEFSINTSTQLLTLNILENTEINTRLTIVQKCGYIWTSTESLLTSPVIQAEFLREKEAELPGKYYYGE